MSGNTVVAGQPHGAAHRHPHRRRQPRRRHAADRARQQAVGLGRRHRDRRRRRARAVHEPLLAGPRRARGQDPAARAERQPGGGQPVHRAAARAAGGLCTRLPQPVPDELRRPDRPPVGRRRGTEHARGDRHRPVRRATTRGRAARARCPPGCMQAGDVAPVFEYPRSGPGVAGQSITGGAFLSRSFGFVGGQYVFGDYVASKLWIAAPNAARDDIGTPDGLRRPTRAAPWTSSPGPTRRSTGSRSTPARCAAWSPTTCAPAGRDARPGRRSCPPTSSAPRSNRTHGPALAFPSCNPPVPRSAQLTVGTPDANGARRQLRRPRPLRRDRRRPRYSGRRGRRRPARHHRRRPPPERPRRLHRPAAGQRRAADHRPGQRRLRGLARSERRRTARSRGRCRAPPRPTRRSARPARSPPRPTRSRPAWSRRACGPMWQLGQVQVFDGGSGRHGVDHAQHAVRRQGVFVP